MRPHAYSDASPDIGFGPPHKVFHYAYLTTKQREEDVKRINKDPTESDTTQGSDTDDDDDQQPLQTSNETSSAPPGYKQGMTRQEVKALDREIPWRKVLDMPESYVDKFLAAITKEA